MAIRSAGALADAEEIAVSCEVLVGDLARDSCIECDDSDDRAQTVRLSSGFYTVIHHRKPKGTAPALDPTAITAGTWLHQRGDWQRVNSSSP